MESEPRNVDEVETSLKGCFAFAEETADEPGLRSPQLGALHAILAHRSMETEEPDHCCYADRHREDRDNACSLRALARTNPCDSPEQCAAQPDCLEVLYLGNSSHFKGRCRASIPVSRGGTCQVGTQDG